MLVLSKKLVFTLFLTLFISGISNFSFSQEKKLKEIVEKGEYKFIIPINMTLQQAKDYGINKAKINAIENAFGSVITEGNSIYTYNKQTGTKIESNSTFNSISDIYVSGEWIEDIDEPIIEHKVIDNETWLIATVYGRIRELRSTPIIFQINTLLCPQINCATENFKNNQDLFLRFKSPIDGYLTIYLDVPEENKTYRLLPYKSQAEQGSFFVKSDKEYILFYDSLKNKIIDEYTLTVSNGNEIESNKLFIIFNPSKPIRKPILNDIVNLPLTLSTESFQKWLQSLRKFNTELQVDYKYLSISK